MTELQDKEIITEVDLAEALNGNFLDRMKEFAWRAKDHRMENVPVEDIGMFQVHLSFQFPVDQEDKNHLTFDKLLGYQLSLYPITKEELQKVKEANENPPEAE